MCGVSRFHFVLWCFVLALVGFEVIWLRWCFNKFGFEVIWLRWCFNKFYFTIRSLAKYQAHQTIPHCNHKPTVKPCLKPPHIAKTPIDTYSKNNQKYNKVENTTNKQTNKQTNKPTNQPTNQPTNKKHQTKIKTR